MYVSFGLESNGADTFLPLFSFIMFSFFLFVCSYIYCITNLEKVNRKLKISNKTSSLYQ